MTLTLIEGNMNSGKTLAMTYYALKDYQKGRIIVTNYNLNIPHYEINKDFLTWLSINQPDLIGYSIFLDELWLWVDSRSPMSNRLLTYTFLQSSKNDSCWYFSTQAENQIDLRIRDNSHIIVRCERKLLLHNKMHKVKNRIRDLGSSLYPYIYIKVQEYDRAFNGLNTILTPSQVFYLKANWLFKYYDTNQKMKFQNEEIKEKVK